MAGDLPAKTNVHVERWGLNRELVEHTFRWSPRTLGLVGLFGIAVPYFIYNTSKVEFDLLSKKNGKPVRNFA